MTPVRVKLSGFLSYADEQELSFDGSSLWLLSGPNGSGKSAVFDAITYALFGEHRGGKINAAELIHKEKTGFAVEFDFTLDGRLFRAKRTLRRAKKGNPAGTQQMFAYGDGDWAAVSDTAKKAGFDQWVQSHVGLTFDTFTSSVLLLQGKAEKLLDSKPAGRAEVLAGIVDLARYQALHERAVEKRKEFEAKRDELKVQTEGIEEVTAEESSAAESTIAEAETAREHAATCVAALAEVEVQARLWQDAAARHAKAENEVRTAEGLLAEAAKIESAFARVTELRSILPAIHLITSERANIADSDRKTERYLKDRGHEKQRQENAEREAAVARGTRDRLKADLAKYEEKHAAVAGELRNLDGVMVKARLVETQDAELKTLEEELSRFPKAPKQEAEAARSEADRLSELARVVPVLSRFHAEREELARSVERRQTELASTEKIKVEGETVRAEYETLQSHLKKAGDERASAERAAAGAAALAEQARAALSVFESQAGAKTCQACGQPLTPAHFQEEKKKRLAGVAAAEQQQGIARQVLSAAVTAEAEWSKKESETRTKLEEMRTGFKDHSNAAKQAAVDVERHDRVCRTAYLELPQVFQQRIAPSVPADWTRTHFPGRDELSALTREAAETDVAKQKAAAAQGILEKWQLLYAKAEEKKSTRKTLAAGLPADVASIREKHATAQAADAELVNAIKAARRGIENAEREADTHARDAQSAKVALAEITGKVNQEEATREKCRAGIERAANGLSADWQLRVEHAGLQDYFVLQGELDNAVAGGVEEKYKRLEQTRGRRQVLTQQVADAAKEMEAFPPEHRRPSEEVRAELVGARQAAERAATAATAAKQAKVGLEDRTKRRTELVRKVNELSLEVSHYQRLAELLGRDRLQRHLVRTAERQIVDHANAVLDRLSGGQLRLIQAVESDPSGAADKALDLDAVNRAAGGDPIPVAFLSGSQKFRVAVALALGIGRYASRQHRPIESVILDEGFGCLDRVGRQAMIQELHALRGQLARVLVVSHQEEFAEAFTHGYKFELENGKTRVERFGG